MRIAAVADLHIKPGSLSALRERFEGVERDASALLLPGDLTDHGLPEEARLLAEALSGVQMPIFAVLGNHDYSAGRPGEVVSVLAAAGVRVLDGHTAVVELEGATLGIVGVKGFPGGYGEHVLARTTPQEPEVQAWVDAALAEAGKIEAGLLSLRTDYRLAMLHYSPVLDTIRGEVPETYPFYGTDRLCEPLDRIGCDLVVHGHSHYGTHRGSTPGGIPVYNVAARVLDRPYAILEVGR